MLYIHDNKGLILAFLESPCLMLAGEGMLHFPGGRMTGERPADDVKGARRGVTGVRGLERALIER